MPSDRLLLVEDGVAALAFGDVPAVGAVQAGLAENVSSLGVGQAQFDVEALPGGFHAVGGSFGGALDSVLKFTRLVPAHC